MTYALDTYISSDGAPSEGSARPDLLQGELAHEQVSTHARDSRDQSMAPTMPSLVEKKHAFATETIKDHLTNDSYRTKSYHMIGSDKICHSETFGAGRHGLRRPPFLATTLRMLS